MDEAFDTAKLIKIILVFVTVGIFAFRMIKTYSVKKGVMLVNKAYKLAERGNIMQALSLYRKALEMEIPDLAKDDLCRQVAAVCLDNSRYEEALEFAEKAVALEPKKAVGYRYLGIVYSRMGKMQESMNAYQKSLEIDPDAAETWLSVGTQEIRRNNPRAAILAYEKAVSLDPATGMYYSNLAYACACLRDVKNAEKYLKLARKHGDKDTQYVKEAIQEAKDRLEEINDELAEHNLTLDDLQARIARFLEETSQPSVRIKPAKGKTNPTDSKFAGKPYQPTGFQWPYDRTGQPMKLLAQLNLAQMPKLEMLPKEGLLQFFLAQDIGPVEGTNGKLEPADAKVLYHTPPFDDWGTANVPALPGDESFPISDEMRLNFTASAEPMNQSDFRFHETFKRIVGLEFDEIPEDVAEQYEEALSGGDHKVGGYAFFTQDDPRDAADGPAGHTIVLLQIDSDMDAGIQWGDNGVGAFLIKPEDLAALDFSNVYFTWDCY